MFDLYYDCIFKHACKYIGTAEGKRLADIGCGTGDLTVRFSQWVPGGRPFQEITGVDLPAQKAAAEACFIQKGGGRTHFVSADASEGLPFPDAHFDVVFSNVFFHNIHDKPKVLNEFARILKSEGTLLISDIFWLDDEQLELFNSDKRMLELFASTPGCGPEEVKWLADFNFDLKNPHGCKFAIAHEWCVSLRELQSLASASGFKNFSAEHSIIYINQFAAQKG